MLHWVRKLPLRWRGPALRIGFNLHPAFRGGGGRVVQVSNDLRRMRIRLSLNWRTRNLLGSIYGGSLFSVTDGPYPTLLMAGLGDGYILWDKAASIRFRKPGYSTLHADFDIDDAELELIRSALRQQPEIDRVYTVLIKDESGTVHAEVERTVYIAHKRHYLQKTAAGGKP